MSVEVGYFWRWFRGFVVTDNLAVDARGLRRTFSVVGAVRPAPAGWRRLHRVGPLQREARSSSASTDNYITSSDNYGDQYGSFNGLDITVNARPTNDLTIQGGFNGGKTKVGQLRDPGEAAGTSPLNPYCHVVTGTCRTTRRSAPTSCPRWTYSWACTFTSKPGLQVSACRHADRERRHIPSQLHRVQRPGDRSRSAGRSPATRPTSR